MNRVILFNGENMNKNLKEDDFRMFPEYAKPTWMNTTTAYIPTTFPVPPELNVGECWYIKFPNATALVEVEIIDVTKQTVVLKQIREISYLAPESRYKKSDIEFVEKMEKL